MFWELNRQRGRVVWIHFNSDWSPLTRINLIRIFQNAEIVAELKRHEVVMVYVDLTQNNSAVIEEMERLEQRIIPLDLIAPKNQAKPLLRLSELNGPEEFREALRLATVN